MSRALFSLFSESSELMELLVAGLVLRKESFFHQHPRTSGVSPRSHPAPASWICQNSHRQNRVFGKLFFFLHLKHSPFINRALNWKSGLSQWSSLWAPFADCEEWWEALSSLYLNQKESEKRFIGLALWKCLCFFYFIQSEPGVPCWSPHIPCVGNCN